ncbi:cytochrome P450 71A4 [Artemisia annua]|uniref:Cytochrome P450 71A4 n=1 Tax=Artemisia annua TaxID=35608 RepID=A0A2U1MXE3_ARTAN|nr:cytochrome P450 71A4 [Artemisia annua]
MQIIYSFSIVEAGRATLGHDQEVPLPTQRVLDRKIKDQLIRARAYLSFAIPPLSKSDNHSLSGHSTPATTTIKIRPTPPHNRHPLHTCWWWWPSSSSKNHKNKPPSPRKLPIIGNLHQIGLNPHRSLQALTQKLGPLVLIQLGSVPVLVASSAEAAREILKTHDVIFASRPKLSIPHALTYGSKDIAFSPYGEYWRHVRSIAVLQLLSSKRVQSFRHVREEETRVMLDKIGKSSGSVIDLGELLNSLTNNIICRVALGRTYQGVEFNDLLVRFTYLLGSYSVGNYIPWLSWVDRLSGLESRTKKVAEEFDEFLERVLEEHIDKKNTLNGDFGGRNDAGQDLVDILLDVQRENTTNFILHRDVIKAAIMCNFEYST